MLWGVTDPQSGMGRQAVGSYRSKEQDGTSGCGKLQIQRAGRDVRLWWLWWHVRLRLVTVLDMPADGPALLRRPITAIRLEAEG